MHGVKLLGGPSSVDFDFCNELVMKRVAKTIRLMDAITKINDPQCELLLLYSFASISRLYFTMRTCPPRVFESTQRSFDVALCSSLERIVIASRPGFVHGKWRLATLPFAFGWLRCPYSASDVLNYAFLASRLQSVGLQTKVIQHTGIVSPRPIFDDALSLFNTSIKTDLLSNPCEIATPKLMKKMTDIYFTRVTKNAESTFYLSPRQMSLWTSQREDHTSDWLRAVPISGLGQTMNEVFVGLLGSLPFPFLLVLGIVKVLHGVTGFLHILLRTIGLVAALCQTFWAGYLKVISSGSSSVSCNGVKRWAKSWC
ncbi:hypothetical protein Tco_0633345 [Tanacetum coccineum]